MPQAPERRSARWSVIGTLLVSVLFSGATLLDSPVADAAMNGDIEAVRALLEDGADVNAAQGDGMTALHWAAEVGDMEMVGVLLSAGARVQGVTRLGDYTPLHLASKAGNEGIVGRLLDAGADASAFTTTGEVTPLHFAAASGSAASVEALLDHGAVVNARESVLGQTPLMLAAGRNRLEAVRMLLENAADPSIHTETVDIPARERADRAAEGRRDEVFAAFKEEQAPDDLGWRPDPRQVQAAVRAAWAANAAEPTVDDPRDLDEPDYYPRQDVDDIQYERPEDVGEPPPRYSDNVGGTGGFTALIHATREGHVETSMALLDAGADIDRMSGGDHSSPLLIAVINGHFDLAMLLLDRGADPNLASDAGATPLFAALNVHWAPKARYPQQNAYKQQQAVYLEVMEALLKAGADPDARLTKHLWYMSYTFDQLDVNTTGATPFWRAAYATDVPAMRLLIAHGADPNIATRKVPERRRGRDDLDDLSGVIPVPVGGPAVYPIHAATGVGYGEGFAGNAHRHAPDGWLPAARYLLEELGADVNARDLNAYTPLHHAAARGDDELIRYLVGRGADLMVVSRKGQTTVDMANGPVQRIQPLPETIALLEGLGAINNHNCVSC